MSNKAKLLLCLVLTLMLFSLPVSVLAAGLLNPLPPTTAIETSESQKTIVIFVIDNNTYTVNGELTPMDVSPAVIEGRTMLPIRFAATPLGAEVGWDNETRKVTVSLGNTVIELWIGQSNALVNGVTVPIDANNSNVKPLIINDRTMLPIRFVTESLGCDVHWDDITRKVTITKTDISVPPVEIKPPIVNQQIEIKSPGFILPEVEPPEVELPEIEQSIDPIELELELNIKPQDYQLIVPDAIGNLNCTWGEQPVGKSFYVNMSE